MEGRNVSTKREESPKQGLTSAKDLPWSSPRDASVAAITAVQRYIH